MAKIINNKVRLRKTDIDVTEVLNWMRDMGRYVTSVELRDQFNWPLRETARGLMRLRARVFRNWCKMVLILLLMI